MSYPVLCSILVPVDFSDSSLNALDIAAGIAKKNKAILYLLFIDEPSYTRQEDKEVLYTDDKARAERITRLLYSIKDQHDIIPNVITKNGHVVETVIDTAMSEKVSLIIMGTFGETGSREHFIGTNTYNVIKYSDIPVLSIPPKQRTYDFQKALLPVRSASPNYLNYELISCLFSDTSTLEVLDLVNYNDSIKPDQLEKVSGKLRESAKKERMNININLNLNTTWDTSSTISRDIFRFAQLRDAELIIVTPGLDGVTRKGFIGPHVHKIISSSQLPVLTIKKAEVPEEVFIHQ